MDDSTSTADRAGKQSYQLFMLALCLFALVALGVDRLFKLPPDVDRLIQYADFAVCLLFLLDFAHSFATATNRKHYFFTWGRIDLLTRGGRGPAAGGPDARRARGQNAMNIL